MICPSCSGDGCRECASLGTQPVMYFEYCFPHNGELYSSKDELVTDELTAKRLEMLREPI